MSISSFQDHLRDRISLHAERVQSFRLGSAAQLRDELEDKLSQVWVLTRNDDEGETTTNASVCALIQTLDLVSRIPACPRRHPTNPNSSH
jgi:hypothetical protein